MLETNPELKNKIKTQGKNFILEKFNTKKIGEMWCDFIENLK